MDSPPAMEDVAASGRMWSQRLIPLRKGIVCEALSDQVKCFGSTSKETGQPAEGEPTKISLGQHPKRPGRSNRTLVSFRFGHLRAVHDGHFPTKQSHSLQCHRMTAATTHNGHPKCRNDGNFGP